MKEESVFSKGLLPVFLLHNKSIFKWLQGTNQFPTSYRNLYFFKETFLSLQPQNSASWVKCTQSFPFFLTGCACWAAYKVCWSPQESLQFVCSICNNDAPKRTSYSNSDLVSADRSPLIVFYLCVSEWWLLSLPQHHFVDSCSGWDSL